jgi:hypothetical protein
MQDPVKDEDGEYPIATGWRPTIVAIVDAIAKDDSTCLRSIASGYSPAKAERIRRTIAEYGETVLPLPEEAWRTSVSRWMGSYWDVAIDLWTAESGASDLVLFLRIFEEEGGFRFELDSIHVP